eukprot:scaffold163837_cov41-Prasinocladus_malaysianus.AAC.1
MRNASASMRPAGKLAGGAWRSGGTGGACLRRSTSCEVGEKGHKTRYCPLVEAARRVKEQDDDGNSKCMVHEQLQKRTTSEVHPEVPVLFGGR